MEIPEFIECLVRERLEEARACAAQGRRRRGGAMADDAFPLGEAAARVAARDWVDAWNARDLDRILGHYAEAVELWSPTVVKRWGIASGRLSGIDRLRKHFAQGLALAPDLKFELVDVLRGMDGYTIVYRRESGALVADVVAVDRDGKARSIRAYYSAPPSR